MALLLLIAEGAVRVATWADWEWELRQYPEITEKLDRMAARMPYLTADILLGPPDGFPVPDFGDQRRQRIAAGRGDLDVIPWTTFGELTADSFEPRLPATAAPPGVVRLVFVGGSTTHGSYPLPVAARMDAAFGGGRVELVNLAMPASNSATSLSMMRRFLPVLKPDLVVVYHGHNDVSMRRAKAQASAGQLQPGTSILAPPARSRGLWDLLRGQAHPFEDPAVRRDAIADALAPISGMVDLAKELGFELRLSTFARPDYAGLTAADRDRLAAMIRYLTPILGSLDDYQRDLDDYNAALLSMAQGLGVEVIDVAKRHPGGAEFFRDNCHRTRAGRDAHAAIAMEALRPLIAARLGSITP